MKLLKKVLVGSAVFALAATFGVSSVYAEDNDAESAKRIVSWSHLEAGYVFVDRGKDSHGLELKLTKEMYEHFHFLADFEWTRGSMPGSDKGPDVSDIFVGVGGHHEIAEQADIFLNLGWNYVKLDPDSGRANEQGDENLGVEFGARGFVSEDLELGVSGYLTKLFGDDIREAKISSRYYFTSWVALGLDFTYDDEDDYRIFGGLRLDFGNAAS